MRTRTHYSRPRIRRIVVELDNDTTHEFVAGEGPVIDAEYNTYHDAGYATEPMKSLGSQLIVSITSARSLGLERYDSSRRG